jgi:hypothetical protein
VFVAKGEKIIGGCKKLQNVELHNLHPSPNAVMIIKSERIS